MSTKSKPGMVPSLRSALSTYFSLSREQKKAVKKSRLEGVHTATEWLELLQGQARFDYFADQTRKHWATVAIIGFFVLVFGAPFTIPLLFESEFRLYHGLISTALVAVPLISFGSLFIYYYLKFKDVPNWLREFVVPLLFILQEETHPEELVRVQLDFRPKARKSNQTKVYKNYQSNIVTQIIYAMWGLIPLWMIGCVYFGYEDGIVMGMFGFSAMVFITIFYNIFFTKYPRLYYTWHTADWFDVQTRLLDGTLLHLRIQDEVEKRKITRKKRGRSGKTKVKTKTKYKIRANYWLRVGLPHKNYEDNTNQGIKRPLGDYKIKIKRGEKRQVHQYKTREKHKDIHYVPSLDLILSLVGRAYQKVKKIA